jgi:tetratricopeptide (TPR) repeat protein
MVGALLWLLFPSAAGGVAVAGQEGSPFVVELAEDADTRGDWIGTYGSYAYILCGMRAPESLYGGKGWPLDFSVATGDPKETGRAWLSTAPANRDRSVLLEPNALKRTPGSFDDHGEARPLGKGPDLHIRLSVPEGKFLLSLYFFEIDWIQYRAYRIRIFAEGQEGAALVTSEASNFFKGKYRRFAVIGPGKLLVVIERGQSPNAEISGIFLDKLEFPDLYLFDRTADSSITEGVSASAEPERAGQAAEDALRSLIAGPQEPKRQAEYVRKELECFRALQRQDAASPEEYYRGLDRAWAAAEGRTARALAVLMQSPHYLDVSLLQYYAARAHCNYKATRDWAEKVAQFLLERSLAVPQPWLGEARYLREYALVLMEEGRRTEARPLLQAYVTFCLKKETPEASKENLVFLAERALKAGIPAPAAQALSEWQNKHGTLSTKERLLLGSLYYVGGENKEAFEVLKSVEPEMTEGNQHRWCLVAMITTLLRLDRLADAQELIRRFETEYAREPELDEVKYRLGAYYFDKRELKQARECFSGLIESSQSDLYRRMSDEYLGRIEHLEDVAREMGKGG